MSASRRRFLKTLVSWGFCSLLGGRRALGFSRGSGELQGLRTLLSQLFVHPESAQALGREYLAVYPAEGNAGILTDLLVREHPNESCTPFPTEIRTTHQLRQQVREDFDRGRLVTIRGWLLSYTEARLSALAALLGP